MCIAYMFIKTALSTSTSYDSVHDLIQCHFKINNTATGGEKTVGQFMTRSLPTPHLNM